MNPFSVRYNSDYFCDRENELQQLKDNVNNELNTLIHSYRRLGKSSLIHHLFNNLEKSGEYETIYVDLFAGQNLNYLIKSLSENILQKYHYKNILTGITKLLKGVSPGVNFTMEGYPQLSLNLNESQLEPTLAQLFSYLESRNKKIVIAFDEFQEVSNYPEKEEAILRTHIQQLKNITFIFSGSSNHLLHDMFFSAKRPFYQSTEVLVLEKIEKSKYAEFIKVSFQKNKKNIEDDAIEFILDFTETYTYYTQVICNHLFYRTKRTLSFLEAHEHTMAYLESRKVDYMNLAMLLSENQKKVAIAIAKESAIKQISSSDFIHKHKLPGASSVNQSLNALLNKEIVLNTPNGFQIYDVFFKRYLEYYY